MPRPGTFRGVLVPLLIAWALLAAVELGAGALAAATFEVDMLHLMEAAMRGLEGQRPHVDYITPMGDLFLAMLTAGREWFGLGLGASFAFGNVLAGAAVVPLAALAGAARLGKGPGLALGLFALLLAMALTPKLGASSESFAMAYNRWGWALALPVMALMLLPPQGPRAPGLRWAEGLAVGAAMGALFWIKASFAAGLVPLWLAWVFAAAGGRAAAASALAGPLTALLVPALVYADPAAPLTMIPAYVADLLGVAGSAYRPEQVLGLASILSAPDRMLLSLGLLIGGMSLLRAGLRRHALLWAVGAAGMIGTAWQNHLSELTGAFAFAAVLPAAAEAMRRQAPDALVLGLPAPAALRVMALCAAALGAQLSAYHFRSAFSGWHAAGMAETGTEATIRPLPGGPAGDIAFTRFAEGPTGTMLVPPGPVDRLRGACKLVGGVPETLEDLRAAVAARPDLQGRTMLGADIVNVARLAAMAPAQTGVQIWMFDIHGDALDRADLLAVPVCPFDTASRARALDEAEARGLALTPVLETPLWTLLAVSR
ncbi:hypothetical protein ACQ5SO_08085 [Rhodovulum sp. DZ06]|uniref:hypothetical protein n=1 Tax=Rhodovulum sp. DZ06 TaxID=3425126 RepID=UPI003D34713C